VNTDGTAAVVVMNRAERSMRFELRIDGRGTETALPPRSIATYLS